MDYSNIPEDEFCSRFDYMMTVDFPGSQLVPNYAYAGSRIVPGPGDNIGPDYESIMLYPSINWAIEGCGTSIPQQEIHDKSKCPLLILDQPSGQTYAIVQRQAPFTRENPGNAPIPADWWPLELGALSARDKSWIRQTYPWGRPAAPVASITPDGAPPAPTPH